MSLKRRLNAVILLLIFVVFGCAPVQFSSVKPEHASDLPCFLEFQGLKMGIQPYLDPKVSREVFGTDLLSKGVLPILVIIENDTNSTFRLEQKRFALYPASQQGASKSDTTVYPPTTDLVGQPENTSSYKMVVITGDVAGAAAGAHFVANITITAANIAGSAETAAEIASLPVPVGAIFLGSMVSLSIAGELASRQIQVSHHMIATALADRTLHRGESVLGFIYFTWDSFDEKARAQEIVLRLTLQNLSKQTVWHVDLPLGRLFPKELR